MTKITDQEDFDQPKSVIEIIISLKDKIKAGKDKAKVQFLNFVNQTMLRAAPDLRAVLNRVRDELRNLNPQQAMATNMDSMKQVSLPHSIKPQSTQTDLG